VFDLAELCARCFISLLNNKMKQRDGGGHRDCVVVTEIVETQNMARKKNAPFDLLFVYK
jgi:hypothetical protein